LVAIVVLAEVADVSVEDTVAVVPVVPLVSTVPATVDEVEVAPEVSVVVVSSFLQPDKNSVITLRTVRRTINCLCIVISFFLSRISPEEMHEVRRNEELNGEMDE
jgi:hypothetical protein